MTLWLISEDDWRYDVYPYDVDCSELGPFASILATWQSKILDGRIPAWRDFELDDTEGWWGWISIYDLLPGERFDFHCRLWGTELARFHDVDFTNHRLRDINSGMYGSKEVFDHIDVAFIRFLIEERMIGHCEGRMHWRDRSHVEYTVVRLPLADDGVTIDKILNVTHVAA